MQELELAAAIGRYTDLHPTFIAALIKRLKTMGLKPLEIARGEIPDRLRKAITVEVARVTATDDGKCDFPVLCYSSPLAVTVAGITYILNA